MANTELHITVVSGFEEGPVSLHVAHETALVKAALLYADRVTLASPRVALLAMLSPILTADDDQRAAVVQDLAARGPDGAGVAAQVASLQRKKHPTVDERYRLRDLRRAMLKTGDELAATVEDMLTKAGVSELALAMRAGVLDLDSLGLGQEGGTDGVMDRVTDLLHDVVGPGSTTFPLLDEATSGLLSAMVREGVAPGPDIPHLAQPALGTRWIGEMEAFPSADMRAVLELREALNDPLIRYRQAIITVSEAFRFSPLDAEFSRAATTAYQKNVTPELLHLRELAREKRVVSLLTHTIGSGLTGKVMGAGLGFIGASAAAMPQLVGVAAGLGLDVATEMRHRHNDLSNQQRQNAYFYLFEAERRAN